MMVLKRSQSRSNEKEESETETLAPDEIFDAFKDKEEQMDSKRKVVSVPDRS